MNTTPVVLRPQAESDVDEAVAYYEQNADAEVALRFVDALNRAYAQIVASPGPGSPRYTHVLKFPGLRHRPLARFPHLVFYIAQSDHLDIVRVLHSARDIPTWVKEPDA